MAKQTDEIQLELDEILKKLDLAEKEFKSKMDGFDFSSLDSKKEANSDSSN